MFSEVFKYLPLSEMSSDDEFEVDFASNASKIVKKKWVKMQTVSTSLNSSTTTAVMKKSAGPAGAAIGRGAVSAVSKIGQQNDVFYNELAGAKIEDAALKVKLTEKQKVL